MGDQFLLQVGTRLLASGTHFVARLSGDEFAIFCEDTKPPSTNWRALSSYAILALH